jgi:hypothetical protein
VLRGDHQIACTHRFNSAQSEHPGGKGSNSPNVRGPAIDEVKNPALKGGFEDRGKGVDEKINRHEINSGTFRSYAERHVQNRPAWIEPNAGCARSFTPVLTDVPQEHIAQKNRCPNRVIDSVEQ